MKKEFKWSDVRTFFSIGGTIVLCIAFFITLKLNVNANSKSIGIITPKIDKTIITDVKQNAAIMQIQKDVGELKEGFNDLEDKITQHYTKIIEEIRKK